MGKNRNQVIVRASVVGIVTNLLLAGFKAFCGDDVPFRIP